jgi:hypothetical protein
MGRKEEEEEEDGAGQGRSERERAGGWTNGVGSGFQEEARLEEPVLAFGVGRHCDGLLVIEALQSDVDLETNYCMRRCS